jgi:hypothetical protein
MEISSPPNAFSGFGGCTSNIFIDHLSNLADEIPMVIIEPEYPIHQMHNLLKESRGFRFSYNLLLCQDIIERALKNYFSLSDYTDFEE